MTTVLADTSTLPGLAELIAERHRLGRDGYDEVWNGVYHVAAMARFGHGQVQMQLGVVLAELAPEGLVVAGPVNIGLDDNDFRVPGAVAVRDPVDVVWVPTAAMVVEVRSSGDDTYLKFEFYHARGVEEILVADLTGRELHLYARRATDYAEVDASAVLGGASVARIAQDLTWAGQRPIA